MKSCHLCMPAYNGMSGGAARGLVLATAAGDDDHGVNLTYTENSLLAYNCNQHLALVRNQLLGGCGPDYFAVLHSDVGPEPGWLSRLVRLLEAHGLDALGVVIPIKSGEGWTSTAVGRLPLWAESWNPLFRVTLTEALRLPGVFTAADLGYPDHPLLVNTGCFVMRVDPSWFFEIYFTIRDRIHPDPETGRHEAQVQSEDWFLSRLLFALGRRVAATRLVRVDHRGAMDFDNDRAWGLPPRADWGVGNGTGREASSSPGGQQEPRDVQPALAGGGEAGAPADAEAGGPVDG